MIIENIAITVLSSTTVTGILVYILKRAIDRSLETHYYRIQKENEALIGEKFRREAHVYDDQYGSFRAIPTLVYRLRNILRELIQKDERENTKRRRELLDRFQTYYLALEELLYEDRAILPKSLFAKAHELKSTLHSAKANVDVLAKLLVNEKDQTLSDLNKTRRDQLDKDANSYYQLIDKLYSSIVEEVHEILHVNESHRTPERG